MAIKRILAPLDGGADDAAVLTCAAAAARRLDAHIDALHVRPDPAGALHYLTRGLSVTGGMKQSIVEAAQRAAGETAARARAAFDEFCVANAIPIVPSPPPPDGVSAAWHEEIGKESVVVATRGRLADLIVLARPRQETPAPLTLEAALMESGRPVLVTPPTPPKQLGGNIAIGWNGSVEAASAVAAALPFLAAADKVTVLTTREQRKAAASAAELAEYLGWHGIEAPARMFETGAQSIGEALLAEARTLKVDLLVLGGYGHSRSWELVLGGVTRHVLAASAMPVFLAH
ncbi:MAG: universal stress protein [Dongiaceae bacterium]